MHVPKKNNKILDGKSKVYVHWIWGAYWGKGIQVIDSILAHEHL